MDDALLVSVVVLLREPRVPVLSGKATWGVWVPWGMCVLFSRDFVSFQVAFYAYDSTVQLEYDSTLSSNVS